MKILANQSKRYHPHTTHITYTTTKRGNPISTKWEYGKIIINTITIDHGKMMPYWGRWIYQDYYTRKVPKI